MQSEIQDILRNRLGIEVPRTDLDLFESAVLDSMAFVELLLQLEQRFGITVTLADVELEAFRTVESIAGFIATRNAAVASIPAPSDPAGSGRW